MDAFPFRRLPDLAFRDVVQGMEPMDILHATQTSQKTRCLMRRNARLPITIDVNCGREQCVWFEFCGSYDRTIRFVVNPPFRGPHSRLYKFGKDEKDWSETSFFDNRKKDLSDLITHWNNKLEGFKTLFNFLADTFLIRSVSFAGCDDESFNVLKHILDRKLPIQELEWDSELSTEPVDRRILKMATAAKEFWFSTPRVKPIKLSRFPDYFLDKIFFKGAHWITRDGLCALNNCLRVEIFDSQFTGTDLNDFLKHLIRNNGRAKKWEISSFVMFEMETVLTGIKYDEIDGRYTKEYTIERDDGVKMIVKNGLPSGIPRRYTLKLKVSD